MPLEPKLQSKGNRERPKRNPDGEEEVERENEIEGHVQVHACPPEQQKTQKRMEDMAFEPRGDKTFPYQCGGTACGSGTMR